jgi:hypothetical protein
MLLFLILPFFCARDIVALTTLPRRWFRTGGQIPLWSSVYDEQHQKPGPIDDLGDWIKWEENVALEKLLYNAAPGGKHVRNLLPGTIVASPSRESPDYYYQCTTQTPLTVLD